MKTAKPWLKLSSAAYCPEGLAAMNETLDPGQMDPGAPQRDAEFALAAHLGVNPAHVLLTGSCTAALTICHHFLCPAGRPLECPALTWPSSYCYAPDKDLVDTDESGWPIWSDRSDVLRVLVALWGRWVWGPALNVPPRSPIILDAAHAFGSGLPLLATGQVAAVCYSFGSQKEVPCVRGGAIISPHITAEWRAFRESGTEGRYPVYPSGGNFKIAEPFAALLIHQLAAARDGRQAALRRALMDVYYGELPRTVRLHTGTASGHLCVIQAASEPERNRLAARLTEARIQYGWHYPLPAHLPLTQFPNAWALSRTILTLPLHLHLSLEDVQRICRVLGRT